MNHDFFRALETRRTRALVERDLETIEVLHAPEYQLISPPGRTFSKARYIELIKSAPFYSAWEHGHIDVRVSAEMAVVRYKAKITFPSGRVVNVWHTDTYELQASSWLAVWSQATELPNEPPAAQAARVMPNPSLKRSTNGRPPGPVRWYAVHFHRPGPGVLPLAPA